jgi:hypothetical protein
MCVDAVSLFLRVNNPKTKWDRENRTKQLERFKEACALLTRDSGECLTNVLVILFVVTIGVAFASTCTYLRLSASLPNTLVHSSQEFVFVFCLQEFWGTGVHPGQ